jgi:hypothetical protein
MALRYKTKLPFAFRESDIQAFLSVVGAFKQKVQRKRGLPVPGSPSTKYNRSGSKPPHSTSSSPGMPVETRSSFIGGKSLFFGCPDRTASSPSETGRSHPINHLNRRGSLIGVGARSLLRAQAGIGNQRPSKATDAGRNGPSQKRGAASHRAGRRRPRGGSRKESVIPPDSAKRGQASLVPTRRLHLSEVPPTTMEKAKPAENKRCQGPLVRASFGPGMGSRQRAQLTRHSAVLARVF